MSLFRLRQVIPVLVVFAVGAGSLLVPESALAAKYLFRVERQFYGAPQPAATSPGGAGRYQNYIEPYVSTDGVGNYNYPPAIAIAQPGNPIGGAFTLPSGFIDLLYLNSNFAWGLPGYTSISGWSYYNGPGRFGPSNPYAATTTTRLVFPTPLGNPTPNYGSGAPSTPTTTFSGRYDFDRAGSINVTPGPNRFGGTMQLFHRPAAYWYAYIWYFSPNIYKAYGSVRCQDPPGVTCTPSVVSSIGDITSTGMVTRFLLNNNASTGTGNRVKALTAKATTPISLGPGTFPTSGGYGTPKYGNPASYIAAKNYYLHTIHPWTTGFASVYNPLEAPTPITPQLQGYDTSLGGANITVTHVYTAALFNSTLNTVTYTQQTYKQYLMGVERVVSMVRPRLQHRYTSNPVISNFRTCRVDWRSLGRGWPSPSARCAQAARLFTMKVFFLPEPTGLLLGAGVAALLGLSRMRRR
jgi:hypothetical protein